MVKVVNVDGNIGAGKTTFIKHLIAYIKEKQKNTNVFVIEENVDKDDYSRRLLQNYYLAPKKFALKFQKWIVDTKMQQFKEVLSKVNKDDVIIFDRSFIADNYVFCHLQHELGNISDQEFEEYQDFFKHKTFGECSEVFGTEEGGLNIYLNTSVDNCYLRILNRCRNGETQTITKEYLQKLETNYERVVLNSQDKLNIMIIDGNKSIEQVMKSCKQVLERVFVQ